MMIRDITRYTLMLFSIIILIVLGIDALLIPDLGAFIYILVVISLMLIVIYPLRSCIVEILTDYRTYRRDKRRNKPVKILHNVKPNQRLCR